jgi:hypothetical protein
MVKVPVLSEHIESAPPIVSHAYILLTKFLSFIIFYTEYANEIVTDKGKPSGIATVNTTIESIIKFKISIQCLLLSHFYSIPLSIANLIINTINIIIAEYNPNLPISSAIIVNFSYNGVANHFNIIILSSSSFSNDAFI